MPASFGRAVPAHAGLGGHAAPSSLRHELSPRVPRRILTGTGVPAPRWKGAGLRGECEERVWGQHQPDPAAVSGSGAIGSGSAGTDPAPAASPLPTVDLITSSPQCLHSLVTWAHAHAGGCQSVPSLQSVLSSEYCGIIRAVWGCGDGHDYVMDTDSDCSTVLVDNALSVKREWSKGTAQRLTDNGAGADNAEAVSAPKPQHAPVRTTPCQQPANKGTTSVPLNVENEPPQNRDSSHSQLDSTASLQEKALPQPVSPLSSATGKGFAF